MNKHNKLFVGGDLSGIQKFLYNISSKKAAVSLRGRSEYLNRYMHGVSERIRNAAKSAGAKLVEEIYCSGGKFYLLTDNTPEIVTAIEKVYQQEQEKLWMEHVGQLGLNVASAPFTELEDGTVLVGNESIPQKCGVLWERVNEAFGKQKNQKFKTLLEENFAEFFEPIPVGGDVRVCAVTGVESPECVKLEDMYVLPSVNEQIEIGEKLRDKEKSRTFGEYAGNTKLGVLRMDVDGLGKRFIEGFNSIENYRRFSNQLKDFFEIEVRKIQQNDDFKDHLTVIYAGGDDLFIVGKWDIVIDFAEKIHEETEKRFKDEGISISGGIAIVHPKFPIAKAAELAGEAECAAKKFSDENRCIKKNAFHFLGRTVSWDNEFEYVKNYKERFCSLIEGTELSKGILHKIMLYDEIAQLNKKKKAEGKPLDYSYKWHLCYYLARYKKRYEKNMQVQKLCDDLNRDLADNDRNLEKVALAARWAELTLKTA